MADPILITSALPYANGSIHIGHLVEYIQTDIWVRFLKMTGQDAVYMCADDTHGTPIEVNARRAGITPEELIARYYDEHQRDFADFHIQFDCFYSTNSEENRHHAEYIFEQLRQQGHIVTRPVARLPRHRSVRRRLRSVRHHLQSHGSAGSALRHLWPDTCHA
jgi:methionyl-tRNA synthetase